MKKRGRKTGNSITEKLPKLDEETKRKTNHLYVAGVNNFQNLARKIGEENMMLID